jgi:hypothetical protein
MFYLLALAAAPLAALRAQSNPCGAGCAIVFDWGNGGAAPDVDRIYGSPATMEARLTKALADAGWNIVDAPPAAAVVLTFRPTIQNRVRCEKMSGTNTDMSCHTVERGTAMFVSNDSTVRAPQRVEVIPRCSDPKAYPSFAEFGQFAGETIAFQAGGGKGSRPRLRCRL